MGIEIVTEHLLDCVEAVDDRHVFDDLLFMELDEVRDAIADGVAVIVFGTKRRSDRNAGLSCTSSFTTLSLPAR